MSQLRFLCDEDVSRDIVTYLRSTKPAMDILVVGEAGAPPKQTPDVDVYRAAVAGGRTLVSRDKKTMHRTVVADLVAGGHNWGAIFIRRGSAVASCADDLNLIWFCETTDDWIDRIDFIPY
jgi:Domain of unknown function (DUF5615)